MYVVAWDGHLISWLFLVHNSLHAHLTLLLKTTTCIRQVIAAKSTSKIRVNREASQLNNARKPSDPAISIQPLLA